MFAYRAALAAALLFLAACDSATDPLERTPAGIYALKSTASLWPFGTPAPAGCERPTDGVLSIYGAGTYKQRIALPSGERGDQGRVTSEPFGGAFVLRFTSDTGRTFQGEADGTVVNTFDGDCFMFTWERR